MKAVVYYCYYNHCDKSQCRSSHIGLVPQSVICCVHGTQQLQIVLLRAPSVPKGAHETRNCTDMSSQNDACPARAYFTVDRQEVVIKITKKFKGNHASLCTETLIDFIKEWARNAEHCATIPPCCVISKYIFAIIALKLLLH